MTGARVAEVTTLTAEVRVLMVGSRQVTMSVYRQLDEVDEVDLEAFGRVNVGPTGGADWMVGRSRRTGALARARVRSGVRGWEAYDRLPLIVLAGLR